MIHIHQTSPRAKKKGFYFTIVSGNHQVVATSEVYVKKSNAVRAAKQLIGQFEKKLFTGKVEVKDKTAENAS